MVSNITIVTYSFSKVGFELGCSHVNVFSYLNLDKKQNKLKLKNKDKEIGRVVVVLAKCDVSVNVVTKIVHALI